MSTRSETVWPGDRRRNVYWLGVACLGALLIVIAVDARHLGNIHTGDSNLLVHGARVSLDCIRDTTFWRCGGGAIAIDTSVAPFPLLQYLPAMGFIQIGLSDDSTLQALSWLSLLALLALLAAICYVWRDRPQFVALALPALTASSLLYQSTSAFGEALAATIVGCAALAAIRRRLIPVILLVFFASLAKETIAPFVAALAILCVWHPGDRTRPAKPFVLGASSAAVAALVVSALFNVFRFGTWRNVNYFSPEFRTPGLARKAEFFGGILVAPTNGVAWYWPMAALLGVMATACFFVRLARLGIAAWRQWICLAGVLGCALLWFGGLSAWYTPFGWIAYGPRLQVPLLPGLLIAIIHLTGDEILRLLRRHVVLRLVLVCVGLFGLLQYQSPWRFASVINRIFAQHPACATPAAVGTPGFYDCSSGLMWRIDPLPISELLPIQSNGQWFAWILGGVASVCFAWIAMTWREVHDPGDGRQDFSTCDHRNTDDLVDAAPS